MSAPKPPATTNPRPAAVPAERDRSTSADVAAFLKAARAIRAAPSAKGRLILALDATLSRQPTWDLACALQADMFDAAGKTGSLDVQLVYFRGQGECRASKFAGDSASLKAMMAGIQCRGGLTQIGKVLAHGLKENGRGRVNALVYIGDALEEDIDQLCAKAGELGLRNVPVFIFQEGGDPVAERGFREIARLSRGAWFRFDRSAAGMLAKLLSTIAVYASGGLKALESRDTAEDRLLIAHLRAGGKP